MYLTTVKELGTALLTKGTAFALTQTATQTNNSSVNDVLRFCTGSNSKHSQMK